MSDGVVMWLGPLWAALFSSAEPLFLHFSFSTTLKMLHWCCLRVYDFNWNNTEITRGKQPLVCLSTLKVTLAAGQQETGHRRWRIHKGVNMSRCCVSPALGKTAQGNEAWPTPGRATPAASPQRDCCSPGRSSRRPWAADMGFCWWKVRLLMKNICKLFYWDQKRSLYFSHPHKQQRTSLF